MHSVDLQTGETMTTLVWNIHGMYTLVSDICYFNNFWEMNKPYLIEIDLFISVIH